MTKKQGLTARARGFLRSNRAVSALEYAILVGVVVLGIVAALNTFSGEIRSALTRVGNDLANIPQLGP